MKRYLLVATAVAICGVLSQAPKARAVQGTSQSAAERWPGLSTNNQWLMVETETLLDHPGGAADVLAICQRAKQAGYNGMVLWDSNLWEKELPPGYLENAAALKKGLHDLDFTLMVEM